MDTKVKKKFSCISRLAFHNTRNTNLARRKPSAIPL